MNEPEKCMAGKWYDCNHPIFLEYKNKTRSEIQRGLRRLPQTERTVLQEYRCRREKKEKGCVLS